jgi:uncharacterized DUF497 family protein
LIRFRKKYAEELKRQLGELRRLVKIQILITNHARQRAEERGVELVDVYAILIKPRQTIYDEIRDNYKSYAKVRNRYLVVIHTKLNSEVRVITVIPMNKKGVSENGFRV